MHGGLGELSEGSVRETHGRARVPHGARKAPQALRAISLPASLLAPFNSEAVALGADLPDTDIKFLYCFHQNNDRSKCEVAHPFLPIRALMSGTVGKSGIWHRLNFCFCSEGTEMREHVLLFCLLGLVLIATILLVTEPAAVTWALGLVE